LTKSATNVISRALTNVGFTNEMPYRVGDSEILCSICLETMDEEQGNLFTVSACSHTFHKTCIAKWKEVSRRCPCCREPLPDEIGPTNSSLRNLPTEEVVHIKESVICMNVIFCAVGVAYPLFLLSVFIAYESLAFGIFVVLTFWLAIYRAFQEESNLITGTIIIICIMYPLLVCCMVFAFMSQILYMLFRTLKFYVKVLMCKIRWIDAYNLIIHRTIFVTNYYLNMLLIRKN